MNNKKFLLISVVLGFISIVSPVILHISSDWTIIYQYWFWGFNFYVGREIGVDNFSDLEFIIPGTIIMIFIFLSSGMILKCLLDEKRKNYFSYKLSFIGGSIMIAAPLLLMVLWQLIYTLNGIFPTFWGSLELPNYFWPSFSFLLQFLAGGITLALSMNMKKKKN